MDAETAWRIVVALAVGMAGLGGYIVKLHLEIKELNAARIKWLEDQLAAMGGDE